MAIFNPIAAKFTLALNTPQEIYVCPANKSHAIVDISFLKDSVTGSSMIAVALTKQSNPGVLTSIDYFVDDIELVDQANFAELNKVILGPDERLICKVVSGDPVNCRISGVEEANAKVLAAGKLVGTAIAGTAQTKIFDNVIANVAYISTSLTIYNASASNNAVVEVWVTSDTTPSASDKVLRMTITSTDTGIIENMLLLPNEKIFVRSDQVDTEYFLLGMVVGV